MYRISMEDVDLAKRVARRVAQRWSLVELDDLTSELTVWLYENNEVVSRYRKEPEGEGKLFVALRRFATKYCAAEQATRQGAPLDYSAKYSIQGIERALKVLFDEFPTSFGSIVHPHTGHALEQWDPEIETARAVLMDTRAAFERLVDAEQVLVIARFQLDMTYRELAEMDGSTPTGVRKKLRRALRHMQQFMEGE